MHLVQGSRSFLLAASICIVVLPCTCSYGDLRRASAFVQTKCNNPPRSGPASRHCATSCGIDITASAPRLLHVGICVVGVSFLVRRRFCIPRHNNVCGMRWPRRGLILQAASSNAQFNRDAAELVVDLTPIVGPLIGLTKSQNLEQNMVVGAELVLDLAELGDGNMMKQAAKTMTETSMRLAKVASKTRKASKKAQRTINIAKKELVTASSQAEKARRVAIEASQKTTEIAVDVRRGKKGRSLRKAASEKRSAQTLADQAKQKCIQVSSRIQENIDRAIAKAEHLNNKTAELRKEKLAQDLIFEKWKTIECRLHMNKSRSGKRKQVKAKIDLVSSRDEQRKRSKLLKAKKHVNTKSLKMTLVLTGKRAKANHGKSASSNPRYTFM